MSCPGLRPGQGNGSQNVLSLTLGRTRLIITSAAVHPDTPTGRVKCLMRALLRVSRNDLDVTYGDLDLASGVRASAGTSPSMAPRANPGAFHIRLRSSLAHRPGG